MGTGHFSYLISGGAPKATKVASDRLEVLAKSASKEYLENGTSLNQSITKIASERELNPHQIERVCEIANLSTHQALWSKTAQKDKVAFPLADARKVILLVRPSDDEAVPDDEAVDEDYQMPPDQGDDGPRLMDLMGVDPSECHNGLHEDPEKKRLIILLQKKASEVKNAEDSVLYKGMELESAEKQASKAVRQAVLGGRSFRDLFKAASAAGLRKVAAEYLPKIEEQLIGETYGETRLRLEKTAISKAPDDLVSEDLDNVTVVNGAHPVIVCLDTIKKKTDEVRQGLQGYIKVRDEAGVLRQRIKELS